MGAGDMDRQTGTQVIENATVAPKQKRTKRMKVAADVSRLRAAKRGVMRGEQVPAAVDAIDGVEGDADQLDLPDDEESDEEYTRNKLLSAVLEEGGPHIPRLPLETLDASQITGRSSASSNKTKRSVVSIDGTTLDNPLEQRRDAQKYKQKPKRRHYRSDSEGSTSLTISSQQINSRPTSAKVRDLEQAFSDMLSIQGSQIRKERESSPE